MYKRSIDGWAKHWDFILLDTICLQISFILSYYLRYKDFFTYSSRNPYRTSALVLILLSVVIAIVFNTMHNVLSRRMYEEIKNSIIQVMLVFAGIVILLFSDKASNRISRVVLYTTMILYFVLGIIARRLYRRFLLRFKKVRPHREMLLVGDEKGIERALSAFQAHPEEGVNIKGTVRVDGGVDSNSGEKGEGVENVKISDASEYIRNEWIDEVYIAVSDPSKIPTELISDCSQMAITVHQQMFVSEEHEDFGGRQWVEKIAKQPVLTTSVNIPRPRQMIAKRAVDIVSGLLLSILAVVTLIISAPLIKIASPGPVLLRLERIGRNGKKFHMYMIRTMYMDANERDVDQRVIKGIGSFLRRWSLDQLPKGFNVLLGQMSLIGTRAPSVAEWERYKYHHRARLSCKPGITGLFQVCGGGKVLTFEEATAIDTEYITNWSMGLDWNILFAPAVLRKRYAKYAEYAKDAKNGRMER